MFIFTAPGKLCTKKLKLDNEGNRLKSEFIKAGTRFHAKEWYPQNFTDLASGLLRLQFKKSEFLTRGSVLRNGVNPNGLVNRRKLDDPDKTAPDFFNDETQPLDRCVLFDIDNLKLVDLEFDETATIFNTPLEDIVKRVFELYITELVGFSYVCQWSSSAGWLDDKAVEMRRA